MKVNAKYIYRDLSKLKAFRKAIGKRVTEGLFAKILTTLNLYYASVIALGISVTLPAYLGKIIVYASPIYTYVNKKGKLKTNKPINWKATNEMHKEDPTTRDRVVRFDIDTFYRSCLHRHSMKVNNLSFFAFKTRKSLKRKIMENINNNTFIKE